VFSCSLFSVPPLNQNDEALSDAKAPCSHQCLQDISCPQSSEGPCPRPIPQSPLSARALLEGCPDPCAPTELPSAQPRVPLWAVSSFPKNNCWLCKVFTLGRPAVQSDLTPGEHLWLWLWQSKGQAHPLGRVLVTSQQPEEQAGVGGRLFVCLWGVHTRVHVRITVK